MEKENRNRIAWIDTLRGLAALFVFLHHWACVFKPEFVFLEDATSQFQKLYLGSIFNVITNGKVGVQFFFVCSGLLITKSMYNNRKLNLSNIYRKITSLLKIVIVGVFLSFLLYKFNLMYNINALEKCEKLSFVKDYVYTNPTFKSAIVDVVNTFFKSSEYNGPLWTIKHQLLGSLLISVISYYVSQFANKKERLLAYILFAIPFIYLDNKLIGFFFGTLVYECSNILDSNEDICIVRKVTENKLMKLACWIISIYFACIGRSPFSGIYSWLNRLSVLESIVRAAGISGILFLCLTSKNVQSKLDNSFFEFIGKISSYIYVLHWPILLSLGCYIFYECINFVSYNLLIIIVLLACLLLTTACSFCLVRIEKIYKNLQTTD